MPAKHVSSEQTRAFYDDLMQGKARRRLWGKDTRFCPETIRQRPSVHRYFFPHVAAAIAPEHDVLDLGCGPGNFLPIVSPLCRSLTGADIVPTFVEASRQLVENEQLTNTTIVLTGPDLPFTDARFDRVIMVDTIHHLEDVTATLREVHRILKPSGKLLVFEPNKYNPLLWLMCLLDANERGLLKLGSPSAYQREMNGLFTIETWDWNGLLLGPSSRLATGIASFLDAGLGGRLRWLLPKLFLVARKA
ncbi:methyltransferase domain protein [Desulfovibrio sp. A2]|nr:methyltransferase domain protein [Desulfovibrio sp. A2]